MNEIKQWFILFVCFYFCNSLIAKAIAPGVNYHHLTNKSQSVHILVVDPDYAHIKIGMPGNNCTQKTSTVAKQNNAIAAINGSFFQFKSKNIFDQCITTFFDFFCCNSYNAFATCTLQSNNHLYSISPSPTSMLTWNDNDKKFYSSEELQDANFQESTISPLHSYKNIIASTPLLIHKNVINEQLYTKTSDFYTKREPRTAVGTVENGHWVFVVVDGRGTTCKGFTILELAHFMQKLGCTDALNLCGASRSTMVVQNNVVNSPSGMKYHLFRQEYPVHNALIICAAT